MAIVINLHSLNVSHSFSHYTISFSVHIDLRSKSIGTLAGRYSLTIFKDLKLHSGRFCSMSYDAIFCL